MQQQILWRARLGDVVTACVIERSCAGVDLVVQPGDTPAVRERYGQSAAAYERARALLRQHVLRGYTPIEEQS